MFVWARAVCGTRYGQSPSVGTHPVPGKIHMQKIEWKQGDSRYGKSDIILDQRPFTEPKRPSQDPGARADAQ